MNGPVIFLSNGTKVNPRLRGNNLVTKYGLPEGSCVIPNKAAYMDDETWAKVVKVEAPGIRKMAVSNIAFVYSNLFYSYRTLHLCSSKFKAFSDIYVRLESIICKKGPPLWEVTYHLQIIWRNIGVELDKNIMKCYVT